MFYNRVFAVPHENLSICLMKVDLRFQLKIW